MRRPFTADVALDEARSIAGSVRARAHGGLRRSAPLTANVLVGIEGDCFCRVRNTLTGRAAVYAVSPRVFHALKRARGRVIVFAQDEKIVGFVI